MSIAKGVRVPEQLSVSSGATVRRLGIVMVVVIFLALGLIYIWAIPLFEAPDENWHYQYVRFLAEERRLPTLDDLRNTAKMREAHQAPLYHLVGAVLTGWIRVDNLEASYHLNPHASIGVAGGVGNKNVFLHRPSEKGIPWRGITLAVLILRLESLAAGVCCVLATYGIAKLAFPHRHYLALGAASLTAFNPQFVFLSSYANNDILVTSLCALGLLGAVWVAQEGISPKRTAMLGIVAALASLAKLTGLVLLPVGLYAIALAVAPKKDWRGFLRYAAIFLVCAAVVAGWWYLHNLMVFGEPLSLSFTSKEFGTRRGLPQLARIVRELWEMLPSLWAVFGWLNIRADRYYYCVFRAILGTGSLGMLCGVARCVVGRKKQEGQGLRGLALLGTWPVLVVAALAAWMTQVESPQGRLFMPGLVGLNVLLAAGLLGLLPNSVRSSATVVLGGVLLALAALCPFQFIIPAYARQPTIARHQIPAAAQEVGSTFDGEIELIAVQLPSEPLVTGQPILVTFYWQALAQVDTNYSVFVHLVDEGGKIVAQVDSYPNRGNYPTSQWEIKQVIPDTYLVDTRSVPTGIPLNLKAGLYNFADSRRLAIRGVQGTEKEDCIILGQVTIGK